MSWESNLSNSDISDEILDYIYQNGIKYLEGINAGMKSISDRAMVLLSYLIIAISFAITHIYSNFIEDGFDSNIVIFGSLFVLYYVWIMTDLVNYMKPRKAKIPHQEPQKLLQNELVGVGLKNMKLIRCVEIQNDILVNRSTMNEMYKKFESAISRTFIYPPVIKAIKKLFILLRC